MSRLFDCLGQVIDPSTQEWISVSVAVTRGVYDAANDRYFNLSTGELLSSQDAAQRNLVKLSSKVGETTQKQFVSLATVSSVACLMLCITISLWLR